jgi:hypothetical protein
MGSVEGLLAGGDDLRLVLLDGITAVRRRAREVSLRGSAGRVIGGARRNARGAGRWLVGRRSRGNMRFAGPANDDLASSRTVECSQNNESRGAENSITATERAVGDRDHLRVGSLIQIAGRSFSPTKLERRLRNLLTLLAAATTCASAEESPRLSFQNTTDFASYGSIYTDATVSFNPFGTISEPGWRLQITGSGNRYKIPDAAGSRIAFDTSIDVLAGYQFIVNGWSLLLAAGPSIVNSRLYAAHGDDSSGTTRSGGKVFASLYANPTSNTMLYGQAYYTTASHFYYTQAKTGFALAPNLFVGPEVGFSGGGGYDQSRFGAHVSSFTLGIVTFAVSLGYVKDSSHGKGMYAGTSLQANF